MLSMKSLELMDKMIKDGSSAVCTGKSCQTVNLTSRQTCRDGPALSMLAPWHVQVEQMILQAKKDSEARVRRAIGAPAWRQVCFSH